MSNDYMTGLLIEQRHQELLQEAQNERLARLGRRSRAPRRRWWERLMLFRTGPARTASPTISAGVADPVSTTVPRSTAGSRSTVTVAAGESPC